MVPALFRRYDSFTGVPVCQQNLSLEKASILFNMAALFSQIGTRSNRQTTAGLEEAISSFQKASGMQSGLSDVRCGMSNIQGRAVWLEGIPSGEMPTEIKWESHC